MSYSILLKCNKETIKLVIMAFLAKPYLSRSFNVEVYQHIPLNKIILIVGRETTKGHCRRQWLLRHDGNFRGI